VRGPIWWTRTVGERTAGVTSDLSSVSTRGRYPPGGEEGSARGGRRSRPPVLSGWSGRGGTFTQRSRNGAHDGRHLRGSRWWGRSSTWRGAAAVSAAGRRSLRPGPRRIGALGLSGDFQGLSPADGAAGSVVPGISRRLTLLPGSSRLLRTGAACRSRGLGAFRVPRCGQLTAGDRRPQVRPGKQRRRSSRAARPFA